MLDAVLLEWEGVLADTGAARRDALLRALDDERVSLPIALHDPSWDGFGMREAAAAALGALQINDPTLVDLVTLRASRGYAARISMGISLQPGACAFIDRVLQQTSVSIVTRAGRSETELVLRLAELETVVSSIVCSDDLPDPSDLGAAYDRAIEQLARRRPLQRARVVLLSGGGDALRAARATGIRTVAVGAPAHVAVEADGAVDSVDGLTVAQLAATAGFTAAERRA